MPLIVTKDSVIISHWELIENTGKLPQARENAADEATIGSNFASHWLRKWR